MGTPRLPGYKPKKKKSKFEQKLDAIQSVVGYVSEMAATNSNGFSQGLAHKRSSRTLLK